MLKNVLDHYYDRDEDARLKLQYLCNLLDQEDQQEPYCEELEEFFKLMGINESEEKVDEDFLKYFCTLFDVHSDRIQGRETYHYNVTYTKRRRAR
jgi:hypothetical protein